ncbi:uncharacterized [Tachysurus ichikawai]
MRSASVTPVPAAAPHNREAHEFTHTQHRHKSERASNEAGYRLEQGQSSATPPGAPATSATIPAPDDTPLISDKMYCML